MDIILIAGLWLDASVWDDVATKLRSHGHRPLPLALPGADDRSTSATLDDQVTAVLGAVDGAQAPMVVGHSAACTLAWIAADRRPDHVTRVAMVGGFPEAEDGGTYADFFPATDGVMRFPGWDPFEGDDSADLDEAAKQRMADAAIPVPEGVSKGIVRYVDKRRYDVPVTMICPEFTPAQAKKWIADGQIPELAVARHVSFVDIDSGHWPMLTRPAELADILAAIVPTRAD